jgi:queuine/archaeosine tRNA-ribosyltransferase
MGFEIEKKIKNSLGRAGILATPHGEIQTPAFVAVGTKATVKSLTPEQVAAAGSQVVLANTYHLYLEPGEKIIKKAKSLHNFMNWQGPIMTDSGGFQAFSLGVAYGNKLSKFIGAKSPGRGEMDEAYNEEKEKKAKITEDGVEFRSVIDGSSHFFTPEKSMQIQNDLGADIIFAFDECTSPHASKNYLREAMERTHRWAGRCMIEFKKTSLTPYPLPEGEGVPGYQTAEKKDYVKLQNRAIELRKNSTKTEEILWQLLRSNFKKPRFRRQHIIGNFIVDFVCLEKQLVIEVDGDVHDLQKERDAERTNFLEQKGFKVMRFDNEMVLNNIMEVLGKINRGLETLSLGEGRREARGEASQSLFGIVQGGRYEDLRKESAKAISSMEFDGFGVGGSFVKEDMATAVKWVNEILPEEKPRHLLGVGEPVDLILGVENGCDTFDCVAATRMARNGTLYTSAGKINIMNAKYKNFFESIEKDCNCYTCQNYSAAYISHLFRAKEMLASTLASIHNLYFLNNLMSQIRQSILDDTFFEFEERFLKNYKV